MYYGDVGIFSDKISDVSIACEVEGDLSILDQLALQEAMAGCCDSDSDRYLCGMGIFGLYSLYHRQCSGAAD